jgi:hypothetical protein
MPLIVDTEAQSGYPGRLTWRERLRSGRVVPIISDEALFDLVLGGHQSFLASYARYVNYPFGDEDKLVSLVKYHKHRSREAPLNDQTLKFDFLNYVKNYCYRLAKASGVNQDALDEAASQVDTLTVSEFAHYLGYPRFEAAYWDDPLLILADLPFKTVLTTAPTPSSRMRCVAQAKIRAPSSAAGDEIWTTSPRPLTAPIGLAPASHWSFTC